MRPLILLTLLAGCSSLVPSTVAQLAGLSPLTADPAGFEVALDLPPGIDVVPDSALLVLAASQSETGAAFEAPFVLQRRDGPVQLWRVNPDDLDELRTLQARAAEWEAEDPDASSGSLSVGLEPCRIGDGPAPDAAVSISLRVQPGGPLLPLVRNAPISDFADDATINELDPC